MSPKSIGLHDWNLASDALEDAYDAVVITTAELDPPGPVIVYVNRAFSELTGYACDEVLGNTPRMLQGPQTDRRVLDALRAALAAGEKWAGKAVNYRKAATPSSSHGASRRCTTHTATPRTSSPSSAKSPPASRCCAVRRKRR